MKKMNSQMSIVNKAKRDGSGSVTRMNRNGATAQSQSKLESINSAGGTGGPSSKPNFNRADSKFDLKSEAPSQIDQNDPNFEQKEIKRQL